MWWSTIPPISTKQTISSHFNSLKTKLIITYTLKISSHIKLSTSHIPENIREQQCRPSILHLLFLRRKYLNIFSLDPVKPFHALVAIFKFLFNLIIHVNITEDNSRNIAFKIALNGSVESENMIKKTQI